MGEHADAVEMTRKEMLIEVSGPFVTSQEADFLRMISGFIFSYV